MDGSLLRDIPATVRIVRIPQSGRKISLHNHFSFLQKRGYIQRWLSAFLHFTDSREKWNRDVRKYINEELKHKEYDAVIFTSPPYSLAFLAADYTKKLDCPVILDLRDPWSINPYKIYPTILHRLTDRAREKSAISIICCLISAYQSTLEEYAGRIKNYPEKNILFLPNGFDEEDFQGFKAVDLPAKQMFSIGFSGSFYSHLNTPNEIFKAISMLKKKNLDVAFHHIGESVQNLNKLAKDYDIEENVFVWGYQKHRRCLEILNSLDSFCFILDDRSPTAVNTIGGKIYEYLRLHKPILAVVPKNGEAANLVKYTDSGLVVPVNCAEDLVKTIEVLAQRRVSFSWKGIEIFSRKTQAHVLHDFLTKL
jgi:glycosyltransferase involved in cell wall biosynthesis